MKKMNQTRVLFGALLLMCMAFTSCSLFDKDDDPVTPVLSSPEITVAEGETGTVYISGDKSPYQISSGNADIASVTVHNNTISVKGLSIGTTSVTITGKDKGTTELLITVVEFLKPVLTPSTVNIRVGDMTTVAVSNGIVPYQLSGGDATIASVAINGTNITVKGIKKGISTVTVSGKNGGTAILTVNVEESLVVEEQDRYNEFVTPELEKVLTEELGMTINRGISPPTITGYYRMKTNCTKSTIPGDEYVGTMINHYKMRFFNQKDINVSLDGYEVGTESYEDYFIARHEAPGTFICGEGNSFTVFFNETVQDPGGPNTINFSVYSGTLDKNASGKIIGIKNFQYALLMRENNGRTDKIDNGDGRLFVDNYVEVITKEKFETIIRSSGTSVKSASSINTLKSVLSKN